MNFDRLCVFLLLVSGMVAGCARSNPSSALDTGQSSETVAKGQESVSGITPAAKATPQAAAEKTLVTAFKPSQTELPPLAETVVVDLWANRRYVRDLKLEDTRALALIFMGSTLR